MNIAKIVMCAGIGLVRICPAWSHDFWIQPATFILAQQSPVAISLLVGHGPARQNWGASLDRITTFRTVAVRGGTDQRASLHLGAGPAVAELAFGEDGTHMIVLQTNLAESELPSIRFNAYAKDEGLTAVLKAREQLNTADQPGREIYSRRAKALVRVGDANTPQADCVVTAVGLSLEIVPERDPYLLAPAQPLPVRVLYGGKPLEGALVKLTNLEFDQRPVETHLTDAAGRASFRVPHVGTWLVNTI